MLCISLQVFYPRIDMNLGTAVTSPKYELDQIFADDMFD